MASDIIISHILPGQDIVVQVIELHDNFFTVINKKDEFKGLLIQISEKNNEIFEKLLKDCKELCDKDEQRQSLCCIADSTLNHNTVEVNFNNENNSICTRCKNDLKKVPKVIKKSISKEVLKLTNHGFNKNMLQMKNPSPRRGTFTGTYRLTSGKMTIKMEKSIKKEEYFSSNDIENNILNTSRFKVFKNIRNKSNTKIVSRKMSERVLKTQANEKIIDLCTKRKSIKITPTKKLTTVVEVEEKKPKLNNTVISNASVYDFVDDDCESEPLTKYRPIFTIKPKRKQKNTNNIKRNIDFLDVDVHSNPGITYFDYDGIKFSINDIVWAKIPGYPFWPAHIYSLDNVSLSKSSGKRCIINWIGWDQQSFLPLKSLLHFKDNFDNKFSPKLKSVKYKLAVELACKELKMDFHELLAESLRKMKNRINQTVKKKSLNLDEIFNCRGENNRNLSEFDINQERCSEDDDTDEEEKARSALITAESIEANSKLSGLIKKVD